MPQGILLVDKPAGITSYTVVDRIKKGFSLRKVGHGGTLDPMATGLLILLVGRATKGAGRLLGCDKEYEAEVRLGKTTDSQDITGKVIRETGEVDIDREAVEEALEGFRGEIDQVPPMVSALKHRGKRLYQLARKGIEVPRDPRKVTIKELELRGVRMPLLELRVRSSKGTYIRTLAHDLGEKLGCGACLASLRRTAVGPFKVEDASSLDELLKYSKEELAARLIPSDRFLINSREEAQNE